MNKNTFNSYVCTLMVTDSAQKCSAEPAYSQHNCISNDMCFEMMCKMMMS
ncbi:MAG: hypothetical protein ACN6N7_12520 [Chryseobacterium culicis]